MYQQIMEQIKLKVMVGDWPPGYSLPSIRELAASVKVSVITVKRAYLELEREGVINTQQGKGSFIAEDISVTARLQMAELDEHMNKVISVGRLAGLSDRKLAEKFAEAIKRRPARKS
jgi:GntR family transcriptional regulator